MTEREFANGIVKETGTAEGLVVVTEIKDKGIIEAVAETGHIQIGAGIATATETDIGIGKDRSKNGDFLKVFIDIIF